MVQGTGHVPLHIMAHAPFVALLLRCMAGRAMYPTMYHLFHSGTWEWYMVGKVGFEPTTSWSRTKRASRAALLPELKYWRLHLIRLDSGNLTFLT